jgi:hypothetical protein
VTSGRWTALIVTYQPPKKRAAWRMCNEAQQASTYQIYLRAAVNAVCATRDRS